MTEDETKAARKERKARERQRRHEAYQRGEWFRRMRRRERQNSGINPGSSSPGYPDGDTEDLRAMLHGKIGEPTQVDVDGRVDPKTGIQYIGSATLVDGKWRCLANVNGALCIVEVNIRFGGPNDKQAK